MTHDAIHATMPTLLIAIGVVRSRAPQISVDRSSVVMMGAAAATLIVLLAWQALAARRRASALRESFGQRLQDWIDNEKTRIITDQSAIARREAQLSLAEWKQDEEEAIRQDAIKRSQSVIVGKVTEHMVPFLPDFPWNPKDARFIGAPIDFLVFDGLDEGRLRSIVFVEVKTASSPLTAREKQIREAVEGRRIGWREIRIDFPAPQPQLPSPPPTARRFLK